MNYDLLKDDSICAYIYIRNGNSHIFLSGVTQVTDVDYEGITFESLVVNLSINYKDDRTFGYLLSTPTWLQMSRVTYPKINFGKKKLTIEDIVSQYGKDITWTRYVKWKDVEEPIRKHILNWEREKGDTLVNLLYAQHLDSNFIPISYVDL